MTQDRMDMLYIGVREGEDKPILHLWYDLSGIANDGSALKEEPSRHHCYAKPRSANIVLAAPGQIYSFERSEARVYPSTARYVGRWLCQDDVVRWTAECHAIERTIELKARARKEAKERLDWETLEPFRQAYHGHLNYRQQQMLLAQIIHYVTKHKSESKP